VRYIDDQGIFLEQNGVWAYGSGALLLGFLYAQVHMSVLLNSWRRDFFDLFEAIEMHTLDEFWRSLWRFTWIALIYVFFAIITSYLTRLYSLFMELRARYKRALNSRRARITRLGCDYYQPRRHDYLMVSKH
jgi:ABC-type long-subunit fatty acid transport system fused permease/ATPase subunit